MKKFTPKEILELLAAASALGILDDKSAISMPPNDQKTPVLSQDKGDKSGSFCGKHSEYFIEGQYGPYCRSCYAERKEKNFKKNRSW